MTEAEAKLAAEVERLRTRVAQLAGAERERDAAFDQQTAMATVLSAVARAGSDPEPVLFDIAEQARRLPDGDSASFALFDGDVSRRVHVVYTRPINAADLLPDQPFTMVAPDRMRATRQTPRSHMAKGRSLIGEMLRSRRPTHFWGTREEFLVRYPDAGGLPEECQELSRLVVPLLVNGQVIGYLMVSRLVARPFTEQQIALLQAFADQAVIAVENARLLNELQESLDQQTATASILGSISDSPGNQDIALTAVTEAAFRLCHADGARVWLRDSDELVGHLPRI